MNGVMVKRYKETIFIPLPREQWKEIAGGCSCQYCSENPGKSNGPAYWDTLAVAKNPPKGNKYDGTWTVHYPELHGARPKAKVIA